MIEARPELDKLSDYVPGKSIDEIRTRYGLSKVVKLASNENPLGASPKAMEAYMKIASSVHLYPRGDAPHLVEALASKYRVKHNQVIIGNGSDEVIDMVGKTFIRPGDTCLSLEPTFSVYRSVTYSYSGHFASVNSLDQKEPLKELAKKIDEKTRIIFICNPNNPTGGYFSEDEIVQFMVQVPRHILVFVDEAYAEFATAANYPSLIKMIDLFPNLLLNRTFSKIYGLAGLRVGYAISSPQVISNLWKVKPPFDVNLAAQEAALAALQDTSHIKKTLEVTAQGIEYLTKALSTMGYRVLPTQANFICVHIGADAKKMVSFLEEKGMIIRGLSSFGMPEWVRITIGKHEENQFLLECVNLWRNNGRD